MLLQLDGHKINRQKRDAASVGEVAISVLNVSVAIYL